MWVYTSSNTYYIDIPSAACCLINSARWSASVYCSIDLKHSRAAYIRTILTLYNRAEIKLNIDLVQAYACHLIVLGLSRIHDTAIYWYTSSTIQNTLHVYHTYPQPLAIVVSCLVYIYIEIIVSEHTLQMFAHYHRPPQRNNYTRARNVPIRYLVYRNAIVWNFFSLHHCSIVHRTVYSIFLPGCSINFHQRCQPNVRFFLQFIMLNTLMRHFTIW